MQRSQVLGNKIEMEITDLVEKNTSLLRLGLHLEFNDARHRVAAHLQRNIDRSKYRLNCLQNTLYSAVLMIYKVHRGRQRWLFAVYLSSLFFPHPTLGLWYYTGHRSNATQFPVNPPYCLYKYRLNV